MPEMLISVVAATFLGVGSIMIYGPDVVDEAWVDVVFWSILGAGAAVSLVDISLECVKCRVARLLHWADAARRCSELPCVK